MGVISCGGRFLAFPLALLLLLSVHCTAAGGALFRAVPESRGDRELIGVDGVARFRFVSVDLAQLGAGLGGGRFQPAAVVTVNLFPDVTVRAELVRSGQGETDGRLWVGELAGAPGGRAIFAVNDRTLSGTVTAGGRVYQIRNDGGPVHVIRELTVGKSAELFPLLATPGGGLTEAEQLFRLVNEERRMRNLYLYEWCDTLAAAAQAHSRDMARRSFFGHVNPNGLEAGERMRAAGYDWACSGENVAAGQRAAVEVLEAWLNSSGHSVNLLRRRDDPSGIYFYEVGVGYVEARGTTYGHYWTLKLGTRSEL